MRFHRLGATFGVLILLTALPTHVSAQPRAPVLSARAVVGSYYATGFRSL